MQLQPVEVVNQIDPQVFKEQYYEQNKPIVIKDMAKSWSAYDKWNWQFFKELVGDKRVPLYHNEKSDGYTAVNMADDYKTFGEYVDMISKGPAGWRIFLFNIFDHAPQITQDFTWPEHLMRGFVKRYPMLFVGGASSITHMHFDIDMSHILHTQFSGRKKVLLFPHDQKKYLYRKPFEVLSEVDFTNYYLPSSKVDYTKFPNLKKAQGYEIILEHGDTLFMPAGYWHHMEYLDSGFAMSLRALQKPLGGKLHGFWNLFGMRSIDTVFKKVAPKWWYNYKQKRIYSNA
jgi:Cupin-like domain